MFPRMRRCSPVTIPAGYVATQDDAEALEESREELVDGHVRPRSRASRRRAVGNVLPVDQHVANGGLHGDDGMEGGLSERSGDG